MYQRRNQFQNGIFLSRQIIYYAMDTVFLLDIYYNLSQKCREEEIHNGFKEHCQEFESGEERPLYNIRNLFIFSLT